MFLAVLRLVAALALLLPSHAYPANQHTSCEKWAAEGECINNPTYLWENCQEACAKNQKDSEEECPAWAEAGECSANPGYILLRCPESCGEVLAWNPYMRRKLGIRNIPAYPVDWGCPQISSVLHAAVVVHERLKILFFGGADTPNLGLALAAPSDFNGMYGIAEAILYTNRLYGIVLLSSGNKEWITDHAVRVGYVTTLISEAHYSSDALMRRMMSMMKDLKDTQTAVRQMYDKVSSAFDSFENLCSLTLQPSLEFIVDTLTLPSEMSRSVLKMEFPSSTRLASSDESATGTTVTLLNGVLMPLMGFGTWQLGGEDCVADVLEAIKVGYRHIDSAEAYRNEAEVGRAIAQAIASKIVTREELFIATKLSDESNAGYAAVKTKVRSQLKDMGLDYLDLYMLHSPISNRQLQAETWRGLTELYKEGVIRALGVSNFGMRELEELVSSSEVSPMVVQNKLDVYHVGKQFDNEGDGVVAFAKSRGIVVVAYSSFSAYPFALLPTLDPIVNAVALRQPAPCTAAQVLLKWSMQLGGVAVIPRSSSKERVRENYNALRLSPLSYQDMQLLNAIQFLVQSSISIAV